MKTTTRCSVRKRAVGRTREEGAFSLAALRRLAPLRLPLLVLVLLAGWVLAAPARAQDPVPRDDEAERVFEQGVEAFVAGDYGMAYRRFRHVYERRPLNRKTTAALLMAGKAAYREGDYARAERVLTDLLATYPRTTYADEARETIVYAQEAVAEGVTEPVVFDLGIALPLREQDAPLTQALFNGLRLVVEAHNAERPDQPVRMVFRDTRGTAEGAAAAVEALVAEGADAIVGPLYSDEAEAAGGVAERAGVVLVAPLATDESVSAGREFVFQANPTFTVRGRLMARFAIDNLRLDGFGVVAELGEYGERLAEGFQDEAIALGADVRFFRLLEGALGWDALPEALGPALREAEALYLPITGARARQAVRDALASLETSGARPRVLGNAEWQGLNTQARADLFSATFTDDFHVTPGEATRAFDRAYADVAGSTPTGQAQRLAYTGHDVTRFLLGALVGGAEDASGAARAAALRAAPRYEGLGLRIDFAGGNVNEAIYYLRYRAGSAELLR